MEIDDFLLMQKGFFDKRKSDDLSFAKVAFYIAAIHQNIAGKPLFGSRFISEWYGEKPKELTEAERKTRSENILKQLNMMQKIQDEKDKLRSKQPKTNSGKQVNKKRKVA